MRSNNLPNAMERIRQAAVRDKRTRFTTLWHHVYNIEHLRESYFRLKRDAAPGVDGEIWRHYGEDLEGNLQELAGRLKRGAYRAKPVKRAYIPGRSPHDALNALYAGIMTRKVSWVLDADIRGYFDAIDHEWLMKFIEHRIEDKCVLRHIKKWLNAGVLEDGVVTHRDEGVPQGGSVSPLLANVYLHYVFDLWADRWRRKHAAGDVIIVRFCDDFVVGFQYREDAERFLMELEKRFSRFNLELHKDKTRLIEFGRFAAQNRKRQGKGKPETFDFLGFTHICGKNRKGNFTVYRHTIGKRLRAKLEQVKMELRRRLHRPVPEMGKWLRVVLFGHYRYYGLPGNSRKLEAFRYHISRLWYKTLLRRSQRKRLNWERMDRLINRWLPKPRIWHPYPDLSLYVKT